MTLFNYLRINALTVHFGNREPCVFMPGINEIDDEVTKLLLNHPMVKALIRDGKLVQMTESKAPNGQRTEADMLAYIPKIFDTKLLKKIIKDDGRNTVVDAAKKQLETIVNPKGSDQKEENEHFN